MDFYCGFFSQLLSKIVGQNPWSLLSELMETEKKVVFGSACTNIKHMLRYESSLNNMKEKSVIKNCILKKEKCEGKVGKTLKYVRRKAFASPENM